MEEETFKLLLLGNKNVGKTSFIMRYCDNKYEENLISTAGIDLRNKEIERNNKKIALKIFDTAGQERFRSISKNYFKSSDGILLLYSINDLESFNSIKGWIDSIKEVVDLADIGMVIVGNKLDLSEDRKVSDLMREDLEKNLNIKILEASAKSNINIENCFNTLIDKVYELRFGVNLSERQIVKQNSLKLKKENKKKKHKCCSKENA